MEPDSRKIKGIGSIKQIQKRNKENGSVMPVQVECAKRTFNVLLLSTKNCNAFSLGHRYSNTSCFFPFLLTETSQ